MFVTLPFGMNFFFVLSGCLRFFFNAAATTETYTLSLHDALPISGQPQAVHDGPLVVAVGVGEVAEVEQRLGRRVGDQRSEEHTSELQSRRDLVCRLLLEKKKSAQAQTS